MLRRLDQFRSPRFDAPSLTTGSENFPVRCPADTYSGCVLKDVEPEPSGLEGLTDHTRCVSYL
jgi:hypothetical protein